MILRQMESFADRSVKLYEHQENTLEEIQKQRAAGINTFLVVFPTASGKSKIVEEDLRIFSRQNPEFHALIMAPNTNIIDDWKHRVEKISSGFAGANRNLFICLYDAALSGMCTGEIQLYCSR